MLNDCLVMFVLVASVTVIYKVYTILYNVVYIYFFLKPINLKKASGGRWAVITGSTDGIGKQYAIELGKKGFNLILISRSEHKLKEVKNEIHTIVDTIEIDVITFDFINISNKDYNEIIFKRLDTYDIGILVNNVGMAFSEPSLLHEIKGDMKSITDILSVNIFPVTFLTNYIIPKMLKRKSGIIINVASYAGIYENKEWNIYSASKRYVIHLTSILQKEYEDSGIIIQCVCPLLVCTNMTKADKNFLSPDADEYVRSAIKTIGCIDQTTGYLSHQIQAEIYRVLPNFIKDYIVTLHNVQLKTFAHKRK
uniref:Estradiol 17-beta-dehydrogenase 12 n=1 Tax=Parastrongyloides trichosuri TaxID=131310 RepID=A0A0N4Z8F8_PARTI